MSRSRKLARRSCGIRDRNLGACGLEIRFRLVIVGAGAFGRWEWYACTILCRISDSLLGNHRAFQARPRILLQSIHQFPQLGDSLHGEGLVFLQDGHLILKSVVLPRGVSGLLLKLFVLLFQLFELRQDSFRGSFHVICPLDILVEEQVVEIDFIGGGISDLRK